MPAGSKKGLVRLEGVRGGSIPGKSREAGVLGVRRTLGKEANEARTITPTVVPPQRIHNCPVGNQPAASRLMTKPFRIFLLTGLAFISTTLAHSKTLIY